MLAKSFDLIVREKFDGHVQVGHLALVVWKLLGAAKKTDAKVLNYFHLEILAQSVDLEPSFGALARDVFLFEEVISHEQALVNVDGPQMRNVVDNLPYQEEVLVG